MTNYDIIIFRSKEEYIMSQIIKEDILWKAAEKLRDKCDPADYKNVVFKRNGYLTIHIDGTNNTISTNTSETIGIKRIVGYKL